MPRLIARGWSIPAGLLFLSIIPVGAGLLRLTEIASNAAVTPDNARFLAAQLPTWAHITGGSLLLVLGAFQFSAPLRQRNPRWHRWSGRVAVVAGIVSAIAGVWMTATFPDEPGNPAHLYGFRMTFGLGWAACLALGLRAALRRDIPSHRAWMLRGYAIALGAGTTVLTFGFWLLIGGSDSALVTTWSITAAWVLNLAIAELIIRRQVTCPMSQGAPA